MFGASGSFESPSRPWQVWHCSAFCRPALASPARTGGASARRAASAAAPVQQNLMMCSVVRLTGSGGAARPRFTSLLVADPVERADEIVGHQQGAVAQDG